MTDTSTEYDDYDLNDLYEDVDNPDDPEVLLGIAHHYRDGNNVKKDHDLYLKYLNLSADAGNEKAVIERTEVKQPSAEDSVKTAGVNQYEAHLTGNEGINELMDMADNGNHHAALKLLELSFQNSDEGMIEKYGGMLSDYIHDGNSDPDKADIACKAGDLYMQYERSNDDIDRAKTFYEAAREYGSETASLKIIRLLCNEKNPESAYEAYKSSDLSKENRIAMLKIIGRLYVDQEKSPLTVKAICEELRNISDSEEDRQYAGFLEVLQADGWDGVFQHAELPVYTEELKKEYGTDSTSVRSLSTDHFIILLNILCKGDHEYLMNFLTHCIGAGNSKISWYIENNTDEFKSGALIPYLEKARDQAKANNNNKDATAYGNAIFDYNNQKINEAKAKKAEFEKDFSNNVRKSDYYEEIRKWYGTPQSLKNLTVQNLIDLSVLYTKHQNTEELYKLLSNAYKDGIPEHHKYVRSTREFKKGLLKPYLKDVLAEERTSVTRRFEKSGMRNLLIIILLVILALFLIFKVTYKKTIDPYKSASVNFEGVNGHAVAQVSVDYDKLSSDAGENVGSSAIYLTTSHNNHLKNGDMITVKVHYNSDLLKQKKLKVKQNQLQRKYKVTGLKKGTSFDPFKDMTVQEKGISGSGSIEVSNSSSDPFAKAVIYTVNDGKNADLSDGDTVKITAKVSDDDVAEYQKYLSKTTYKYTFSKLDHYPSDIKEINPDEIRNLASNYVSKHAKDVFNDKMWFSDFNQMKLSHAILISNNSNTLSGVVGDQAQKHDYLVLVFYLGENWLGEASYATWYPDITLNQEGKINPDSVIDDDSLSNLFHINGAGSYEVIKSRYLDTLIKNNKTTEISF